MSRPSEWPLPEAGERILLPQPLIRALAASPLSSGVYPLAFGYYPQARGHQMARPAPDDWLVIYCVDGRGMLELDGDSQAVSAGDLLLLPPGHAHAYRAARRQPWSLYWMHLAGTQVGQMFALIGAEPRVQIGLHDKLVSEFRALLAIPRGGYRIRSFLHAADICRGLLSYSALLSERRISNDEGPDINALHHHMEQHLDQRLSLAQLASAAGETSPWQFIRRYRASTGQTPTQAFLHRKVARACYLLEVSDLTVAQVAQQFGYDDPYYFSRLFKRVTGVSPSRYRQRGR